ncbi:unnamed protein product, partial [Dibothriocephalus latus]
MESSLQQTSEGDAGCSNAWFALNDRLAQVIETTFECLVGCFTSVLGRRCLGEILQRLDAEAAALCDHHSTVDEEHFLKDTVSYCWVYLKTMCICVLAKNKRFCKVNIMDDRAQPDPVLAKLTDALDTLQANAVNPAFMVQLLSRLLHFIGAHLFNEIIRQPGRVSPQW